MWTPTTRAQHSRAGLRYGSDVTDAEWLILSAFFPPPSRCGRHRKWEMREIVNAIFYVLRGGIVWSLLPKDFPPWPTAYRWFARFRDDGTWERINYHLVMLDRERVGREASPTAAVIDSQSVKTTESGGIRGYDAGKKIKGRKRHAMVDTDGRALKLQVHSADIQDRDGAGPLLRASRPSWPFVALGYADGGYAGPRVAEASPIRIEVVRKADHQVGFAVMARRWVVERFFAWINRNRRLAKDFEATIKRASLTALTCCSFLIIPLSSGNSQEVLSKEVRSELKAATEQLAELMRENVEVIDLDVDHITPVEVTKTTLDNYAYHYNAAIVPFDMVAVDGGNTTQFFVALFMIITPDERLLEIWDRSNNPHKHVGLLAFTQLDNRGPTVPDWDRAQVSLGVVTVPVTIERCYGRGGIMTLNVNNNGFGPKITISYDAAATLGPTTCMK